MFFRIFFQVQFRYHENDSKCLTHLSPVLHCYTSESIFVLVSGGIAMQRWAQMGYLQLASFFKYKRY